ncbi:MAG: hypothetical protein KDC41_00375 [Saprospiraceae bacterium]|nr:hypothetical protein [Saprospiraceae bacterium]
MKKHLLLGLIALSTLLTACSNDDDNDPGTILGNAVNCDYAPYSLGSTFTFENKSYDQYSGQWQTSLSTNEVVEITTYLGETWAVIQGQQQIGGSAEGLARCSEYGLTLLSKSLEINGQTITDQEFPMLKLPATVGKTWASEPIEFDVMGFTNKVTYVFEIIDVNQTQTIAGVTYDEVVEVEERTVTEIDGFPPYEGTKTTRYYDKEAGLISSVITFSNFVWTDTLVVSNLIDYDIQ